MKINRAIKRGKQIAATAGGAHERNIADDMHDPRLVYHSEHRGVLAQLRQNHGMAVRKTRPLTPAKMRSGHRFVDHGSVCGLLMAAAFSLGNVSGGRRPRSLADLRLADVVVKA